MPSNTRGKLKDHCSGIHKNTEAINAHCHASIELVGGRNEAVTENFVAIAKMSAALDEFAQALYSLL